MSYPNYRARNYVTPGMYEQPPRGGRKMSPIIIVVIVAAVLLLCCCCVALAAGAYFYTSSSSTGDVTSSFKVPSLFGPTLTPTVDLKSTVFVKTPAASDTGLELTITEVVNPLKTAANVKVPTGQKFIAVTVSIKNTKKTGTPIDVSPADFTVKGFGGLVYTANPKEVVMDSMLKPTQVAPNGKVTGDLIFQVATDDGDLKLSWKNGKTTRTINLEAQK